MFKIFMWLEIKNGYFLNERSLSTYQTWSENIVFAMMFHTLEFVKDIMKTMKLNEEDYKIEKFFICKPVTEEIS